MYNVLQSAIWREMVQERKKLRRRPISSLDRMVKLIRRFSRTKHQADADSYV